MRFTSKLVIPHDLQTENRSKNFCCEYCGSTVELTRDHVIPLSWSSTYRTYSPGDTVRCCLECNSLLSNRPLFCITDRANYLAGALADKYKKVLSMPEWSNDEINELDLRLRTMVQSNINQRDFIRARIANLILCSNESAKNYICKQVSDESKKIDLIFQSLLSGMKVCDICSAFRVSRSQIRRYCTNKEYSNARGNFLYAIGLPADSKILNLAKNSRSL